MLTELPRVQTGIEGLDDLLFGGILEGDTILLAGSPGTGKTSLGMQFLYSGAARYDEPGIFITFEEFPQRIYRDAGNFGWDFPKLEKENKLKVIFTSPELVQQDILNEQGIITEMIREIGARRAVLDSISHLQHHPSLHGDRREAIYGLMNALKRENLTSLLIRELPREEEIGLAPEDFLADGLIVLSQERVREQRMRFVEVMKSRGTPHMPARGTLLIGETGLRVISPQRDPFFRLEESVSTGISRLDDLLGGGIPYGSFYLLESSSGFHEDLLEINFLKETIEAGDIWVKVGYSPVFREEERIHLEGMGISGELLKAGKTEGTINVIGPDARHDEECDTDEIFDQVETIFRQARRPQRVRLQLDLSSLIICLGLEPTLTFAARLLELSASNGGVAFGSVAPSLVGKEALAKIRYMTDGIFCIWNQREFDYLQVIKTINSVRTNIHTVVEIPEPPYVKII